MKSFFRMLFGLSAGNEVKRPASLGKDRSIETKVSSLGTSIKDDTEEVSVFEPTHTEEVKDEPEVAEMKGAEGNEERKKTAAYNLIILDESGSMSNVRHHTISGCNETLSTIRTVAQEHSDIQQFVSIFCFDTSSSRYLFKNVPVERTRDLTLNDYCPNSCTPLYDAIGYTVTQLRQVTKEADSVGLVTIITDGYENASRKWRHHDIVMLIEELKRQGWVFTFIGANIDVEQTSRDLGIDSFMEFEQTDEGMGEMFNIDKNSRRAYFSRLDSLLHLDAYYTMAEEEKREQLGASNYNYFVREQRIAPNTISSLDKDEVFVFGSNVMGAHNGGASSYALKHFGAIMGQAEGLQGQSYAIPTVGNTYEELKEAIVKFTEFAAMHPQMKFLLTEVGCGNAGYSVEQIAPHFRRAYTFGNVYVPLSFIPYVKEVMDI